MLGGGLFIVAASRRRIRAILLRRNELVMNGSSERANHMRKCRRPSTAWAKALVVAQALTLPLACSGRACPSQRRQNPPPVGVVTVESARHVRELPDASRRPIAELRAFPASSPSFEQGSEVKQGDILYHLDPAPCEGRTCRANAACANAGCGETKAANRACQIAGRLEAPPRCNTKPLQSISCRRAPTSEARARPMSRAKLNLAYTTR